VDNPKYYTQGPSSSSWHPSCPPQYPPPPLIPITAATTAATTNDDSEEKMMLWRNLATLFAKYDNIESEVEKQRVNTQRCTDEVYQELQAVKDEIAQVQTEFNENNMLSKHVRKLRKYVNKKCEKMRESVSYSSYDADTEIFAYIDKIRVEVDSKMDELNETYNRDYEMFVERENDLMSKLDAAVKMNEETHERMKTMEDFFMKQIQQTRNYADTHVAGDLREEFSTAICREVAFESKVSANLVQGVNDELTDLITRSNEYHSARYFGTVEDVNQLRETCQTLKQSIGMVDAELSDTKETVEYLKDEVGQTVTDLSEIAEHVTELKDDVYRELDRDYYDLKGYVKRKFNQYKKQNHNQQVSQVQVSDITSSEDPIQMIVDEYADTTATATTATIDTVAPDAEDPLQANDHNVIIIDENTVFSDDEEEVRHT
jgi:HPt (histidine-containing phosphotransfer) domain-containing protein